MSHKHDRLLQDIFHDPVSANLHWREIESLLQRLGAQVLSSHGASVHFSLNGVEYTAHRPHHGSTCSKQDIRYLRNFLTTAGISSSSK